MDVSLYKLALSIERHPQLLSVSPVTLLSLVESLIDLLVEQQISATLWLKLPPGEIWRSEIRRYHEQVKVAQTAYSCSLCYVSTVDHSSAWRMIGKNVIENCKL